MSRNITVANEPTESKQNQRDQHRNTFHKKARHRRAFSLANDTNGLLIQLREPFAQLFHLGPVVDHDVRLVGMLGEVVLVVVLGGIELLDRHELRDDGIGVDARGGELADVALRELLLILAGVEDRRAVLGSVVRPLAVELGGVVRHAEEHFQQFQVTDLRRIEADLHGFRMPRVSPAHLLVSRGCRAAPGIAGHHFRHALDVFEHRIHTPEAASGEHRRLFSRRSPCRPLAEHEAHASEQVMFEGTVHGRSFHTRKSMPLEPKADA